MSNEKKGISLIVLIGIVVIIIGIVAIAFVLNKDNDTSIDTNNELSSSNNESEVIGKDEDVENVDYDDLMQMSVNINGNEIILIS